MMVLMALHRLSAAKRVGWLDALLCAERESGPDPVSGRLYGLCSDL